MFPSYLLWCSYIHTPRLQSTDLTGEPDNHHHHVAAAAVLVLVDVDDVGDSVGVRDDDSVVSVSSPWLEVGEAETEECLPAAARNIASDVLLFAALTETSTCCDSDSKRSGDLVKYYNSKNINSRIQIF